MSECLDISSGGARAELQIIRLNQSGIGLAIMRLFRHWETGRGERGTGRDRFDGLAHG